MEGNGPVLTVQGLTKHFPLRSEIGLLGRWGGPVVKAVDGVSFSVEQGQTIALVGESGCGKTTTAKMLLKLLKPTAGSIVLEGKNILKQGRIDERAFRSKVRAVFQDPWASLNPRRRVGSIVADALVVNHLMTRRQAQARVAEVLELVGLDAAAVRSFPHEFSGGQRQRIAIAGALVSSPSVIVLDEPVSALDVSIRSQIMNLFKRIQRNEKVSYVLIAHDLGTTRYMADTIALMYLGKIVEYCDVESFYLSPKHPYAEALLSAALPAHPVEKREEIVLQGEIPSPVNPPRGCPFHTRCHRKIGERCETEVPALRRLVDGRLASCHLLDSEAVSR